jgi:hypothetical protein
MMNTLKKFFYFTYAVVAIAVVCILFFNVSLEEMLGQEGTISFWMITALLLLALLTIGVVGDYLETRSLSKKVAKMTKENTQLKASLYEKMHSPAGEASTDTAPPSRPSWLSRLGLSAKSDDLTNRPESDN